MRLEYKIKYRNTNKTVRVPFKPYENELKDINGDLNWEKENVDSLFADPSHPIVTRNSILLLRETRADYMSIKRKVTLRPNIEYLVTAYIRNDGITTTQMVLNGNTATSKVDKFVGRVAGKVTTDDTGELELEFKMYDQRGKHTVWLDGFFATEIDEQWKNKSEKDLMELYQFSLEPRTSPTGTQLLARSLGGSPYLYTLIKDGIRMPDINHELQTRGINPGDEVEIDLVSHQQAITKALNSDVVLMSMLEGRKDRVTHAFPKQDNGMINIDENHFPRVQMYSGDGVGKIIADGRPFAEMVNFAMNYYIPITKVLPSVNAIMIGEQASAIMADLGWSKVRGSDYFMTQEQLYVLQSQFIKDTTVKQRRQ